MNQFKLILPIVILMLSCTNNHSNKKFKRLEIWEEIRNAVKEKRIDYLLEISTDTLECLGCNDGGNWISKEEFFSNYLEQIEISESKEYSIYSEKYEKVKGFSKRYRIGYNYGGGGRGEKNGIIYTLLKGEKGIQFQGLFGIP